MLQASGAFRFRSKFAPWFRMYAYHTLLRPWSKDEIAWLRPHYWLWAGLGQSVRARTWVLEGFCRVVLPLLRREFPDQVPLAGGYNCRGFEWAALMHVSRSAGEDYELLPLFDFADHGGVHHNMEMYHDLRTGAFSLAATRDIRAGEALTIAYVSETTNNLELLRTWDFVAPQGTAGPHAQLAILGLDAFRHALESRQAANGRRLELLRDWWETQPDAAELFDRPSLDGLANTVLLDGLHIVLAADPVRAHAEVQEAQRTESRGAITLQGSPALRLGMVRMLRGVLSDVEAWLRRTPSPPTSLPLSREAAVAQVTEETRQICVGALAVLAAASDSQRAAR